jgi:4'-phosphopantetheinyl transferase
VLAGYLQTAPVDVHIERGPGGKPRLGGDPGLAFNMSHSGALAVIAATRRAAVGVDVELLGRTLRPGVIRRALAPPELEVVQAAAEARRGEAFLRHWTAKEAYGKAIGAGLAVGMARVVIRHALTEPELADPALVSAHRGDWSLQRFDPAPGAVGAVVAAGGPWRARVRGAVRPPA